MTAASSIRSDPAAALRGFLNGGFPSARCRALSAANAAAGITTSPRTSNPAGTPCASSSEAGIDSGNERRVRAFGVTTSPSTPSPRVNASSRRLPAPASPNRTARERPSSFSSPT